jgi:antibiotic biosynthesis monooxygenase (ABM) superfamily enzyme
VGWDPLLSAFVLTLVVVPMSVYLVVPWLMSIYARYLAPDRKGRSRCR